ncbi:MAG: 50S ribosomal protein L25 [Terriglobales bacterium]|jgi:large subunit ribosomal protein L25
MATAATANQVVKTEPRDAQGKNHARRVRRGGRVPATVYGAGKPPVSVSVDPKQITAILHSKAGHNTIFDLELEGESTKAMIVDWQNEPIKNTMLHLDLKRIAMDKTLKLKVPIVLTGEAIGVKTEGGIMEQLLREIEVECLPADIPDAVAVEITHLTHGQVLRVKDLPRGGTLRFLTDEQAPVAHIVHVKEVVEVAPVEGVVEAGATPAEPEVIKKGKQETEEGAAAGGEKSAKAEKSEKGKEKK